MLSTIKILKLFYKTWSQSQKTFQDEPTLEMCYKNLL